MDVHDCNCDLKFSQNDSFQLQILHFCTKNFRQEGFPTFLDSPKFMGDGHWSLVNASLFSEHQKLKVMYIGTCEKSIADLRSVTCHMGLSAI